MSSRHIHGFTEKKKVSAFTFFFSLLILVFLNVTASDNQQPVAKGWRAGVVREIITPDEPIWLAGYGFRDHPSEGVLTDIWVKVLAIEDAKGRKVVLITTDLLGFPGKMSDNIRNQIAIHYGLTRSQIILSSSHTHSAPVLSNSLSNIYPLDSGQIEIVRKYSDNLEKRIIALTGDAIQSMVPVQVYSGNGVARFQVNRRNNKEDELIGTTELNGPNDYSVPVLKVTNESGDIMAVAFGYACHGTVLNNYRISGDYPGFAQIELEKMYPGVTAMFFQGTGADQNPLPRRSVPLAEQYGRELAAAVDRVLNEEMVKLEPEISTAYSEIDLTFSTLPSEEELVKIEKEPQGYQKQWARGQLKTLKNTGSLIDSYPYPILIWKLGNQVVMAMGGEVVAQYAIEIKRLFGPDTFVIGYANDVMGYIPSDTILKEGGYEGETSQVVYGMPAKWNSDIQKKILDEIKTLAVKAGVCQVPK